MNLRRFHRRATVAMAVAALVAFAGGAGFQPVSTILAGSALLVAFFWRPASGLSTWLERLWVPVAVVLVLRAIFHVAVIGGDVVIPVVDLLLLLLAAEALRSLDAPNEWRLYVLSFALLLASAAYRPGALFALAFVAYVVTGTVALFTGHLRRQAERHGVVNVPVGRRLLAGVAGLSSFTLLVSVAVFVAFPRVSRGWSGRAETVATSVAGFSDEVSIGEFGARIYGNPEIVLRVEFPDGEPVSTGTLYWRGRSYDRFDGTRWSRSRRLPPSLAPVEWYEERWGGNRLTQRIYAAPLDVRVLFALHPTLDVDAESRIQPIFDNAGDFGYWGSASPAYVATSATGRPSPDALRSASGRFTPARGAYTQLPELPDRIHALADSLTRGLDNPYDRVIAVRDWLRSEFRYTLDLPSSAEEATIDHFLFERRAGHCEYFSTALAVLLRSRGIPARNVNGFLGGEWSEFGGYLAVTQNQAHSWVEVWFPDYGWVPFDATAAAAATGSGATAWFWPGRFLVDALQHRWSKWVLDYDLDTQWNLLDRTAGLLADDPSRPEGGSDGSPGLPWTRLWIALGAGALLVGIVRLARSRTSAPFTTRSFLRLRRRAESAGFDDATSLGPLALAGRVDDAGHPAAGSVSEFVGLYTRMRFGGRPATEGDRARLADALQRAKRALAAGKSESRGPGPVPRTRGRTERAGTDAE